MARFKLENSGSGILYELESLCHIIVVSNSKNSLPIEGVIEVEQRLTACKNTLVVTDVHMQIEFQPLYQEQLNSLINICDDGIKQRRAKLE